MTDWPCTKSEVEKFVSTLDPQLQKIYRQLDILEMSTADTLGDDFQVVAQLLDVFNKRTKLHKEISA